MIPYRHSNRLGRVLKYPALILEVVFLVLLSNSVFAQDTGDLVDNFYSIQSDTKHNGNWLKREYLKYRTFPHLDRAYQMIAQKNMKEALRELTKYLNIDPSSLRVRMMTIILHHGEKDHNKVVKQASIILGERPKYVPALLYRGLSLKALRRYSEAIEDFQAVLTVDRIRKVDKIQAFKTLAGLAIKKKKHRIAIESLTSLSQVSPSFDVFFSMGEVFQGIGESSKAQKAYNKAILLTKNDAKKLKSYRHIIELSLETKDWKTANWALQRALKIQPKNYEFLRTLGHLAYAEKNYIKSIQSISNALSIKDTLEDREFLATLQSLAKREWHSINQLKTALKMAISSKERYRLSMKLGHLYLKQKRLKKALEAFQKAEKNKKEDLSALKGIVQAAEKAEQLQKASWAQYRIVIQHSTPSNHLKLGILFYKQDRFNDALKHFNIVAKRTQRTKYYVTAQKYRAFILEKKGKLEEAIGALKLVQKKNPEDTSLIYYRTQLALKFKDCRSSITYLEEIQQGEPSLKVKENLAIAYEKCNKGEQAIEIYRRFLDETKPEDAARRKYLIRIANLEFEQKKYEEAAKSFLLAAEIQNGDSPSLLWKASQSLIMGNNLRDAGQIMEKLLKAKDLPPEAPNIQLNLAIILFQTKKWKEALQYFYSYLNIKPTPQVLMYISQCYDKLDQPLLAAHYLEKVLKTTDEYAPWKEDELYNQLGHFQFKQKKYSEAAKSWHRSFTIQPKPIVVLQLFRAYRLSGAYYQALKLYKRLRLETLPIDIRIELLDEIAIVYHKVKDYEEAITCLEQANSLKPAVHRYFALGDYRNKLGQNKEAISEFEKAVALDPNNQKYLLALAYAQNRQENWAKAAHLFEKVLHLDPSKTFLYRELSYAYMHVPKNDKAVYWLKRAIDISSEQLSSSPSEAKRTELYRLRKETTEIANRFDFSAYYSYTTNRHNWVTHQGDVQGGAVSSHAGVTLSFRPPVIGYRDARIFQIYTRMLWNINPGTLEPNVESFQGGAGVQYKPFKILNWQIGLEGFFKIGKEATNDLLLRNMFSWGLGNELQSTRRLWNYTNLFGDIVFFAINSQSLSLFAEYRQGFAINLFNIFLLTPHLVGDFRYQILDSYSSSYIEGGGGISIKNFLFSTKYEVEFTSLELLIHYKFGSLIDSDIEDPTFHGLYATGLFRF